MAWLVTRGQRRPACHCLGCGEASGVQAAPVSRRGEKLRFFASELTRLSRTNVALKPRPSFITYYDALDRVHLFAVQPTVLATIGLFMLDVVIELSVWVLVGQRQFASVFTFLQASVVLWTFRTSLFDMVVVAIVRGLVAGLVFWAWRTSKNRALPAVGCLLMGASLVYGVVKWAYVLQTPGSVVMRAAVSAYMVPLSFLLCGAAIFVLIARAARKLSGMARDANGDYLPLPQGPLQAVVDEYDEDEEADAAAADGKGSINDGTKLIPVVEPKKKKKASHASFGRLAALLVPETPLMVMALLMLVVAALSVLVVPYFFGQIIGAVKSGDHLVLMDNIYYLLIFAAVGGVASFFRALGFQLAGQRLVARLRIDFYKALLRQDITFYDREKVGELVNRITTDTQVLQETMTTTVSMLIRNLVTVVGSIVILFVTSWKLTLVMLATVPVITIGAVIYGRFIKNLQAKFQAHLAASTAVASESLSAIRTLRSFTREKASEKQFGDAVVASYGSGSDIAIAWGVFQGVMSTLAQGSIVLVIWYGSTLIFSNEMDLADLVAFMLYSITIAGSIAMLSSVFGTVMQAVGASERVFELMDRPIRIPIAGGDVPPDGDGVIAFEHVSFAYPTRKNAMVLKDVSFEVRSSKITALVGKSGSGKSTCVSLIERFYDPVQGRITLDGVDIRELDPTLLRKKIGYVTQEPTLFAATIRENILFGIDAPETITEEQLHNAGKLANCHDFIMDFAKGYETQVGEKGVQLSGGQRARVAVARALVMNPRILLLDEATAALDAESEHLVTQAIERAMEGRTTIVIAHRLSTIRNADQVLVLEHGKIVEVGRHEQLLQKGGSYADLVKRQLSNAAGNFDD